MFPPLPSRYRWEWESEVDGSVEVGIRGTAAPTTMESLPLPILLTGPTTVVAPLAGEGRIQPGRSDTDSSTGPLQPTEYVTIGPTLVFA